MSQFYIRYLTAPEQKSVSKRLALTDNKFGLLSQVDT